MRDILAVLALSLLTTLAGAQAYRPLGKPPETETHGLVGHLATLRKPDSRTCNQAQIPTVETIKGKRFETRTVIVTGSELAKLGVSYMGTVGGTYNADSLYAVSDTGKWGDCLANDGATTLHYGQIMRTVIQMNNYKVDANASIAVVAAAATVNGRTNTVDLYEIGYGDRQLDSKLIAAKQAVGGAGVNIENYATFMNAVLEAEKYATTIKTPRIELIGYEAVGAEDFGTHLAAAWAMKEVADGKSCDDAVKDFRGGVQYSDGIREVYRVLVGTCGGVDESAKQKAKQLLGGLKIKY